MTILYDTREQKTDKLKKRLEGFEYPFEREKLDYGDYSCKYINLEGMVVYALPIVSIERKMNLDELCQCFTGGRSRFKREFERATASGAHLYLIIENGNIEKTLGGNYRSKLTADALIASMLAWSIRYNIKIYYAKPESTPKLIEKILHYELKEYLTNLEVVE